MEIPAQPERQKDPAAVARGKKGVEARRSRREKRAAAAKAGTITREQEIAWVADHWSQTVTEDDAPTPGAWHLWQWAKQDDKNSTNFWSSMYVKVMQKEKREEVGGYVDDRRKFFRLFQKLDQEMPELMESARKTHVDCIANASVTRVESVPSAAGAVSASA